MQVEIETTSGAVVLFEKKKMKTKMKMIIKANINFKNAFLYAYTHISMRIKYILLLLNARNGRVERTSGAK